MRFCRVSGRLELVRSQNVDITKFETQLDEFKTAFGRNWRLANDGGEVCRAAGAITPDGAE